MEAEFALVQSYYFMAKIDRKGAYRVVTFAADCEFQDFVKIGSFLSGQVCPGDWSPMLLC